MDLKFKTVIRKSKIDGKGLFALSLIPAKKKLGELPGEVITIRKGRLMVKQQHRIALVEFDDKFALNATDHESHLKYINHSCSPNTYMRVISHRVEFYSLHEIARGQELTCNYGETHHDGKLPCRCMSPNCKGYL